MEYLQNAHIHPDQIAAPTATPSSWLTRLSCAVWGHHVDNHVFGSRRGASRHCRCGARYLRTDGTLTRVRHTLSCFLGKHEYVRIAVRDGQNEYACVQCGHPLLFAIGRDPYADVDAFRKKVRYLCGLFGHHVHFVAERDGFVEYACFCGHTFLKSAAGLDVVRHPLSCVVRGHDVRFVTSRGGYGEYVCEGCGHPFCFSEPAAG
jgi:hypothetical protein